MSELMPSTINPIIELIKKSRMANPRKLRALELLEWFEKKPQLELAEIKEKGLVTPLCWMQFNQIATITYIQEANGETKKLYYGLVKKDEKD